MQPYEPMDFSRENCRPFLLEGDGNGVLLLHGFGGSVAHMRPLGEALHEKGYTVRGINLPGHALSEQAMGESGWSQWLQAAKEATLEMKEICDTLTVCGLSMGGVLSLLVAEQMKVDACVTISAPMAVRNKFALLAGVMAPFYPRYLARSAQPRARLNAEYDCSYLHIPTRKLTDLRRLIRLARQNLFAVNCPVLSVQSDADHVIWQGSADYILENVSSQERQKLRLQDAAHVCTISDELPAIVEGMDQLLRRVGSAPETDKQG